MLKVCHMTSAHGAEDVRIFRKECVSLAKAGYEVYLVERGDSYEKDGVKIVGVGDIPSSRLKRMTRGAKSVYKAALALDCDIYHFHDSELLPYGLKLKKKGKTVVFDSHEDTADAIMEKDYIPSPIRKLVSAFYRAYEKMVCSRLDAIVPVTPSQTDYFKNINPLTVEVRNYPILSGDYVEPTFERKAICFAGGISEQWNHANIIKAVSQVPGCSYVLCGAETSHLRALKEQPGWENVDYRGRIPHDEVAKVLSGCTVGAALLRPGNNTAWDLGTMGNTKIFEEMMAGLPIICTDFKLWQEFVDRYDCGICIDSSDVSALVAALRRLTDDPVEAKRMGANGRSAVELEFNWSMQEKILVDLYEKLKTKADKR